MHLLHLPMYLVVWLLVRVSTAEVDWRDALDGKKQKIFSNSLQECADKMLNTEHIRTELRENQ